MPADLCRTAGEVDVEHVILASADDTRFRAYLARAEQSDIGVVIAPDTRGIHPFYAKLTARFARAGVHATAFDYFGRSAGVEPRSPDFDYVSHDAINTGQEVHADLRTAIAHLREATDARVLYLVGFCKGGRLAFHGAADYAADFAGVIGFYGTPRARRRDDALGAPLDVVDRMRIPVQGFFGGADEGIPGFVVEAFDTALTENELPHLIHTYPGAPHSFFDRGYDEFGDECDDAWRRMLGFIETGDPHAGA